ncbi:hypothetical protein VM1G_11840 [Cytospora mali]|uniref:Uncharacterized protein n=1 Tax=Cytospora mali TaxID=578113 RepID=A0A194W9N2_CYTMA|nr:hypothetical protein VM1G_11840 [Valsa mali]
MGAVRLWNESSSSIVRSHESGAPAISITHLDRLPPQYEEGLGPLLQEPRELVYQDMLDLVGLLDLDADAHAVDAGLDKDALVLVSCDGQRSQKDLRRCPGLDLGHIVSLGGLGCEVGKAEGRCQAAADSLEVRTEGLRLERLLAVHLIAWAQSYHLEVLGALRSALKMSSSRVEVEVGVSKGHSS